MPARTRSRKETLKVESQEIVTRVLRMYDTNVTNRRDETEARLQRYAKYRQWTATKDWAFPDASDVALPDMTTDSLRTQDTLHNAVMSVRPPIISKAQEDKDKAKQEAIDALLDYQFFVEQTGENTIGQLAEEFVNFGAFYAFVPWIEERRGVSEVKILQPIPDELEVEEYFGSIIAQEFNGAELEVGRQGPWDWKIRSNGERIEVSFYTKKDGSVEMISTKQALVFQGPCVIKKSWDEVLYPASADNLQRPSPSNPRGAPHVILWDKPTIDEVVGLIKDGYYDYADEDDITALKNTTSEYVVGTAAEQKGALRGAAVAEQAQPKEDRPVQKRLTRLMCFDMFDPDGKGRADDMIWWVIAETGILLKARRMSEIYPGTPPRRPLIKASFMPDDLGLLEIMEGLHDIMKQTLDQTIDAGTFANHPFFFYRPFGSLKPETIRLWPGEGHPLADPQRDVNFPNLGNRDQSYGFNMISLLNQMEEKVTMIGEFNLGRVPPGKASALRTIGGMAMIASQGEARPERILRRYFMGLSDIWAQMHRLNQAFLPQGKKYRAVGVKRASEDPYREIGKRDEIAGGYDFEFQANILNTSKTAFSESLAGFGQVFISDLAFQVGILRPDGLYRWLRDLGKSRGLDPDKYISEPVPGALEQPIWAEEAFSAILDNEIPNGRPAEAGGYAEHLERLVKLVGSEQFGLFTPEQVDIFKAYIQKISEQATVERQQAAVSNALQGAAQQQGGQGQPGRPPEGPPASAQAAPLGPGEIADESLPGAGGGANQGGGAA